MGQAEEIEGSGSATVIVFALRSGLIPEADQTRLGGLHLQVELSQTVREFIQEPSGILFLGEADHEIVSVADHIGLTVHSLQKVAF
jgi:hypothetical protein